MERSARAQCVRRAHLLFELTFQRLGVTSPCLGEAYDGLGISARGIRRYTRASLQSENTTRDGG